MSNPFTTLAITYEDAGDRKKLQEAFKAAALQAHPDKGGSNEAIRDVYAAHEMLQDPDLRLAALNSTRPFADGAHATLHGLANDLLNGLAVTVVSWTGLRVNVQLANGKMIAVKACNLRPGDGGSSSSNGSWAPPPPWNNSSSSSSSGAPPTGTQGTSWASSSWQSRPVYSQEFGNPQDGEEWKDFGDGFHYPYCWVCRKWATYEHRASESHKRKMRNAGWW